MDEGQMLNDGQTLYCKAGEVKVIKLLGAGGQGQVYKVRLNGKEYALKYYFPNCCTSSFKQTIKDLVDMEMDLDYFVWPLYFVENGGQFGYVMDLIPEGYYDITAWLRGEYDMNLETLLKACIGICDGFHLVHATGHSYKDISDANIVINPDTGKILILDNDNVTPNLKSTGVKGTPRFMAPELVSGYERSPNRTTDLYSLAVLLFELLVCEHPLEGNFHGKREADFADDLGWEKEIYGAENACFIFKDSSNLDRYIDQNIDSNLNAKDMWLYYPQGLRNLFIRAFTDGISNPNARPGSEMWTDAFVRMLGMRYTCTQCGKPHFFSSMQARDNQGLSKCPDCGAMIPLPIIKSGNYYIVLNDGDPLYAAYFGIRGDAKLDVIFEAEYRRGSLRLKNKSKHIIIEHKGINIGCEQYTDYISSADSITIDGKVFPIAMPR